jgi:GT2 family glycosyltransferase
MKILLSYSKPHFDPDLPRAQHRFWGASASILARTFYALLSELGEVTYVDASELARVRGQSFDLFVGIINNFEGFVKTCTIGRAICVVVNQHPRARNQLLRQGLKQLKTPKSALAPWELKRARTVRQEERALARADAILCLGNEQTLNSYVRHGVPRAKIKRINYGLPQAVATRVGGRAPGKPRVVYAASEIGFRKGFELVEELSLVALGAGREFVLDVIGEVSTPHYRARLEQLVRTARGSIQWHGWLDSADERYAELLAQADFLLLPSLEEGQAGTLLDGMARGAIPLISERCGIDFAPLGYLSPVRGCRENRLLFDRALTMPADERERLTAATLRYYRSYHAPFADVLRGVLARFVRDGQLHPKISVVLPVFNKAPYLRSLLAYLDGAMRRYPSTELHLILDGCRDASEAVARRFYRRSSHYPVAFDTTPNIFEVKSNNLGLRRSTGEICAIVQDDNYLYDRELLFEAADIFELNPAIAVLGGLAGVNFYPRGYRPSGTGQIAITPQEVYWRQDERTAPELKNRVFEVDACMRGPLFIRKAFLEREGYLDEDYAPLYMDDMDLCFRAWERGYRVVSALMEVENRSLTMAHYSPERQQRFEAIWKRNTDLFYARHQPSVDKSAHDWVHRHHLADLDRSLALGRRLARELKQSVRALKDRARPWKRRLSAWLSPAPRSAA